MSQCVAVMGRVLESAFDKETMKNWSECKRRERAGYIR